MKTTITTLIVLCCVMAITACCCCGGLGSIQYHNPFRHFDHYFYKIEGPDGTNETGEGFHTGISFSIDNIK